MKKKLIKFHLGDIVQLNSTWNRRIGLVQADDKAWWVIRKHFDIANCIVRPSDVVKIIKKKAVPKRYLKYCGDGIN